MELILNNKIHHFKITSINKPYTKVSPYMYPMLKNNAYQTFKIETEYFSGLNNNKDCNSSFDCFFEFDASYSLIELSPICSYFFINRFKDLEIDEYGILQEA